MVAVAFWRPLDDNGWMSQWFEAAPFVHDGHSYATAEHWMMANKARLFGDAATLRKVLACAGPAEVRGLGRQVAGFDEDRWREHRFRIVAAGNLLKFTQHPVLGRQLRATGDAMLVEASPIDRVWGAGVAADDETVQAGGGWPGLNLLGEALMWVRSVLAAATELPEPPSL